MVVVRKSLPRFSPDAPCKSILEHDSSENHFPISFPMTRADGKSEAFPSALA